MPSSSKRGNEIDKLRGNIEAGLRLLKEPRGPLSARVADVCIEDLHKLVVLAERGADRAE